MRRDGAAKMRAIAEEASAHGARIQGRVLRRARRRPRAQRMGRVAVRSAPDARVRGDQGPVRPGGTHESRQDRARRRAWTTRRCSAFLPATARCRSRPRSTGRRGTCRTIRSRRRVSAPGTGGDPAHGFGKAVEMCNNNGHCRKFDAGTMCPSYRVTRDEEHLTRGRANTLRLALSGQLGPDFASAAGARSARPVRELQGMPPRLPDRRGHGEDEDRVHAPLAARARARAARTHDRPPAALGAAGGRDALAVANLRDVAAGREASRRKMAGRCPRDARCRAGAAIRFCARATREPATDDAADVVLFVDTFTNYFEPENARAAVAVLRAGGYRVHVARAAADDAQPGSAAVLRPHVPRARGWSTKRSTRRGAWWPRWRRTSRAARPSSGWSRRAC